MDAVFLKILNMSVSASWLVLVVLALRLLLRKSPRWITVALWALVAVRLVCPFSVESVLSLMPSAQTLPETIVYAPNPTIQSGVTVIDQALNTTVMTSLKPTPGASVNPIQIWLFLGRLVWLAGMAAMALWAAVSYIRLKRKVAASLDRGDGVYICDYIDTPFILGIIRPKIYLPSAMDPEAACHVLAHERSHISRHDHWWKPFGYLLLTVYWFNPLLWLAYILLCRDIELACDEKVIRDMGNRQKKAYSEALLSCSVTRRQIAACPLAFGEVGVKERVKTVLNYKKPAFWIVVFAVLALIVTAVCFLTDPRTEDPEPDDPGISEAQGESPYEWISTAKAQDIQKGWAYSHGDAAYSHTIEGGAMDEFLVLLKGIREEEISAKTASQIGETFWNYDSTRVYLYCKSGLTVWLRYLDDSVCIGISPDSEVNNPKYHWVVENDALTRWMKNLAQGGTWMLSDENRDEIRQLLRMEYVQFFDPREYNDLLFVGCAWDNGRGRGAAVFEPVDGGYHLLKLIRGNEVKHCASGSDVYYCDYGDLRIFLIFNESITGMEWAGAYNGTYALNTHPGLAVAYFPENLNAMYRFCYGGGSTMYMDRNNQTHAQPPEYAADTFANPDDAHSICSNLKRSDMVSAWASDGESVDDSHERAVVRDLTEGQTVQLLSLLNGLPESAFEKTSYPAEGKRWVNVFTEQPMAAPYLELKIWEDAVYFGYWPDLNASHQNWKIHSEELKTFLENFYGGDTSDWTRFAPYPVAEGEITFFSNGMKMTVPNYLCFDYAQTDEEIRFKPKDQSGWVVLKAVPGPLEIDSSDLNSEKGTNYGRQAQWGYREVSEIWSYMNLTISSGEEEYCVLLINEEDAAWVGDFDYHIDILWILDNLMIRENG